MILVLYQIKQKIASFLLALISYNVEQMAAIANQGKKRQCLKMRLRRVERKVHTLYMDM